MKLEKALTLNRETIKKLNTQEEEQVLGGGGKCPPDTIDSIILPNSILQLC